MYAIAGAARVAAHCRTGIGGVGDRTLKRATGARLRHIKQRRRIVNRCSKRQRETGIGGARAEDAHHVGAERDGLAGGSRY